MPGIIETIGNLAGAVSAYFSWAGKRQDLKNAPDMQAQAKAAQDAKVVDQSRSAVADQDADAIRRKLS